MPTLNVIVSADRRLAAVSKLRRVRVESSKKSVATVMPRSAGTLGTGRALISAIESVRTSRRSMSSAEFLGAPAISHTITTPSGLTRTSSVVLVGRFFPT